MLTFNVNVFEFHWSKNEEMPFHNCFKWSDVAVVVVVFSRWRQQYAEHCFVYSWTTDLNEKQHIIKEARRCLIGGGSLSFSDTHTHTHFERTTIFEFEG